MSSFNKGLVTWMAILWFLTGCSDKKPTDELRNKVATSALDTIAWDIDQDSCPYFQSPEENFVMKSQEE